ncbi:hypothetical protein D3C87_1451960 [compost metagenome]
MPASCMLFSKRPVVGPKIFDVPIPVSNRMVFPWILTNGMFCSRVTDELDKKFLSSISVTVAASTPRKFSRGSPNSNGPSESTVTSPVPNLNG